MKLMAWGEHFVTGVDSIDKQHRKLVEMINDAAPFLAEGGSVAAQKLQPLLDRLKNYADTHFSAEEALMRTYDIDLRYLSYHHELHSIFTHEVDLMGKEVLANNDVNGMDLLRFLVSWLSFHILAEDQQVARQMREIDAGASAAEAYAAISRGDGPAMIVLTDAMIDMFSLLTTRNLNMVSLNQELNTAKTELLAANQHLEARVAKRTQELEAERTALLAANADIARAQEQLLQSEKMSAVGQLAAGVAHEINNPIGFVKSNLGALTEYLDQLFAVLTAYESMREQLPVGYPGETVLNAARAAAELDFLRQDIPDLLRDSSDGLARVQRIISDLKDFSHVDEGEWHQSDINHGLESTLNVVRNEIKYKAEVIKELGDLPRVDCIPSQINQVLMNLLVNAAQAIEDRGRITLRTGVDGEFVWIEIADTGKGMTADVRRRVFEPFFTTKPVGKGTGLGLSITWDIIKRHGGSIDVESEPGRGTTFRINLPIKHETNSDPS